MGAKIILFVFLALFLIDQEEQAGALGAYPLLYFLENVRSKIMV